MHGDQDDFFPVAHAQRLYDAANEPKEIWLVPGFTHAESGASPALIKRIGAWIRTAVGLDEAAAGDSGPVSASPNPVA